MSGLAPRTASALFALVPDQLPEINAWRNDLDPIIAEGPKGRQARLAELAERRGMPAKTVRKWFDRYVKEGAAGLVNKKAAAQLWQSVKPAGLSQGDQELVKLWCESFQRKSAPALRAMLRAWREQRVPAELAARGLAVPRTSTPIDPLQGYPMGWSERNLMRYAPDEYALKATRIGRGAAKAHLPLVYTTRAHLYVGQYYLWDDMWHENEVNDLDQCKSGRPLEFHGLDLSSANKFVWGSRVRIETETKHEGLRSADFRFVVAAGLTGAGYHPTRGTTLIVENATAAISEELERILYDGTGGMIKVERGGMSGAPAHAGQYAGRAKGNFRFKAALESLGNLIHNELAALPGQHGMNRDHCPEEMHDGGRLVDPRTGQALSRFGLLKHNDSLLMALAELPPERAQWLQWDICTIQQFRLICEEVYARLNRRTNHALEGWDERYIPDGRGGMRRLSPHEVFTAGRRPLQPIDIETTALVLGHEGGKERTVRDGKIELHDGEISGDALRFDATLLGDSKFLTVLNPFDPERLFCFDARGRFVAAIPRLNSVCRSDVEAVHREMGRAAKAEAAALEPIRRRHLAEARAKAARHKANAELLAQDKPTRIRGTVAAAGDFAGDPDEPVAIDLDLSSREPVASFAEPESPAVADAADFC